MLSLLEGAALTSLLGALITGAMLARGAARPLADVGPPNGTAPEHPNAVIITADSLAPLVASDPFRLTRQPAPLAYDPIQPAPVPEAPPPRPVFAVSGILWGAAPVAFVEGLPGTDGPRLVRSGEEVAGFRISRITREAVIIRGPDTTWAVPIRTPWP